MPKVAIIQMDSTDNEKDNWDKAKRLVIDASNEGAKLIVLPENFIYEGDDYKNPHPDEWGEDFSALAAQTQTTIMFGTIQEKLFNYLYNTTIVYNYSYELLSWYRKIHLFDIDILGVVEKESDYITRGSKPVVVKTEVGNVGITICYDLRFPELFRHMVITMNRPEIIVVPSSFAYDTGKDHWEILLRARAIENQVFILAPNQCGIKSNGKRRYGNSMIIDPWGRILARCDDTEETFLCFDLDFDMQVDIRKSLPCLDHYVGFSLSNNFKDTIC